MRNHLVVGDGLSVSLRTATAQHEPILLALYADRRLPEVAALPWSTAEWQAFIDMQFRAQQAGYGASFPDAEHWIVTNAGRSDEPAAVGRLLVDRRPDAHLIVDLVLFTAWRGRGIGSALVHEVLADAAAQDLPVHLSAAAHDERLIRWYLNLGFVVVGHAGVNVSMQWACAPVGRA